MKREKMKVYKFRPLANELDFKRAKCILETGHFWCSQFWKLNDPMEGLFTADKNKIIEIYIKKSKYKICSFSGEKAFENPIMWGYYANGFKGMAIEIEVEVDEECLKTDNCVRVMSYNDEIPIIENGVSPEDVIKILTHKSKRWKHEDEYRFLKKTNKNFCEIEPITAVYFGNPYGKIGKRNRDEIKKNSINLRKYDEMKNDLIKIADDKFDCPNVSVNGKGVVS